jgi:hypothetical protein
MFIHIYEHSRVCREIIPIFEFGKQYSENGVFFDCLGEIYTRTVNRPMQSHAVGVGDSVTGKFVYY